MDKNDLSSRVAGHLHLPPMVIPLASASKVALLLPHATTRMPMLRLAYFSVALGVTLSVRISCHWTISVFRAITGTVLAVKMVKRCWHCWNCYL